jgi:serine/threonine protein kinase
MASNLVGKIIKIGDTKYKWTKKLDKGTYSTIYEGYTDKDRSQVAIKHMSFKISQTGIYEEYLREVSILEEIESHPNIVKLIDKKEAVNGTDMDVILIFEFCIQNLAKIVANRTKKLETGLPEEIILKILFDISKGLSWMHEMEPPIIHRDVRINNILLGSNGNYKLINFGRCTKKCITQVTKEKVGMIQSDISNSTHSLWRAPEQLSLSSGYPINEKVDIWWLAIVIYILMYFKLPFSKDDKSSQIEGLVSFPQTDKYSIQLQRMVKKMFEPNPAKRLSIKEVFRWAETLQSRALITRQEELKSKKDYFYQEDMKSKDPQNSQFKTGEKISWQM